MTDITMVVVSYHSGPQITELLATLPSAGEQDVEVLVANNAVGDDLTSAVAGHPRARILEMGDNLGYGSAINVAVAASSSDSPWLLVVNPDVEFRAAAIDSLLAAAETDERIGVVGPRILTATGEVYPSARGLPSLRTGVGHAVLGQIWRTNPWTRRYLADRVSPTRARDTGWVSGACMLIRRSVFDVLGGFDDAYFMYFEDVDFGARTTGAGYRVLYAPEATVMHSGAHATRSSSRAMIIAHHESAYRYLSRRYDAWYLAPLRFALRVGLGVRARFARI